MSFPRIVLAGTACLWLAACSSVPRVITEYRIDIQQGNVLSQEAVAQLKPGLTRDQVRFILGTPMLADMFHTQRWDYVYRYQYGQTNAVDTRKLSVFFDQNGKLERISGDVLAGQADELAKPVARTQVVDMGAIPSDKVGKPLPPAEESGFFSGLLDKIGF